MSLESFAGDPVHIKTINLQTEIGNYFLIENVKGEFPGTGIQRRVFSYLHVSLCYDRLIPVRY